MAASLVFHGLLLAGVGMVSPPVPMAGKTARGPLEAHLMVVKGAAVPWREIPPVPAVRRAALRPAPLAAPTPGDNAATEAIRQTATTGGTGGGEEALIPPQFGAAYLDNPPPSYPALARRMRQEGEVRLKVRVGPAGMAEEVRLARSSGHELLDEAARNAVGRWRFVPAKQGGQPVEAWVVVPVRFSLAATAGSF